MATRGRKKSIEITETESTNAENSVLTEFVNEMKETAIEEIKASMPTNEPTVLKDGDETLRDDGFVLDYSSDVHNDEVSVIELTKEEITVSCTQENSLAAIEDNSTDETTGVINVGNEENKGETTNGQTEEQKPKKDVKSKRQTTREVFGSDVFGVVYGY